MRRNRQSLFLCFALILYVESMWVALSVQAQSPEPPRLVLAFYYTWFDEATWTPEKVADMPLEPYLSRDRGVMARHIEQAKSAGIDALVVSWYGPNVENNQTETNFIALLEVAQEYGFKMAIDFETASPFIHGQEEVVAALQHVLNVHATKESYLRVDGKPVVFLWAIQHVPLAPGQASPLDAWRAMRQQVDPEHKSLWIAEGVDINYQDVFDGHHLYSIAWSKDVNHTLKDWKNRVRKWSSTHGQDRLWVATVMPGYNDLRTGRADAFVRDRENGDFYRACWQAVIDTRPDWVIVTSFNEWVEGSQIEPAQSYGNAYIDLTREWSDRFKSGMTVPEPTLPSPTSRPETEPGLTPTTVASVSVASTLTSTEELSATEPLTLLGPLAAAEPATSAEFLEGTGPMTSTVSLVASLELTPSGPPSAAAVVTSTASLTITPTLTPVIVSGDQTEQVVVLDEPTSVAGSVTGEIVASKVPMRSGPGKSFSVIGLLHEGFVVQILQGDPDAEWLQVVAPTGEVGYVPAEFVDWEPVVVSVTPVPAISQVEVESRPNSLAMGTIVTGTKLRKGPSSGFGSLFKVEPGDTFEILGTSLDGSWYQMRLPDGEEGWVVAYKVQRFEATVEPTPLVTDVVTATVPLESTLTPEVTTAVPTMAAVEMTVFPTAGPLPTETPIPQSDLASMLSEDSPRRTEALLGFILIIAGVGAFLIAMASGVMYVASRRGR